MDDADEKELEIEERRRAGRSVFGEWLLEQPNRFSPQRSGQDALLLGVLSITCLLPVGPLAIIRAVRCNDQRARSGLPPSRLAWLGAALGVLGTSLLLAVLWSSLGRV